MLTLFLPLLMAGGPSSPAATVEVRTVDGLTRRSIAVQVTATLAAGAESATQGASVSALTANGRSSLALSPGLWTLSASQQRLWAWPIRLFVDGRTAPPPVLIELWPTGRVSGRLTGARTEDTPSVVLVRPLRRISSDSWAALDGLDPSVRCPVDQGTWTCDLPVGQLDLHLDLSPFIPRYVWGVAVEREHTSALGEFKLERGGSVSGWIKDGDGRPSPNAKVTLKIPGDGEGPSYSGQTNQRGFFQIGPVPSASYDLAATEGARVSHQVRTKVADREERVQPALILEPPAKLEVVIDPPVDPVNARWRISVLSVRGSTGDMVVRQAVAGEDGRWSRPTLPAGLYRLAVISSTGQTWYESPLDLQPGGGPVEVALRLDHVTGLVHVGDEPLKGHVKLANRGAQLSFETDDSGRFSGVLPKVAGRDGEWMALVDSSQPTVRRTLEHVPLERIGESDVRVDLALPAGSLEGVVVDEAGKPFAEPCFVFAHSLSEDSDLGMVQAKLAPADGGRFRLVGLAPGSYRLEASAPSRQSDEVSAVVKESGQPEKVTLVLERQASLTGRVIAIDGRPIPGAELLVFPAESPYGMVRNLRSDAEGRFTAPLPSATREVILRVGALGFARRMLRRAVPVGGDLLIELDGMGGTLVLDHLEGGEHAHGGIYVLHEDGGFDSLGGLLRWSGVQGESPTAEGAARISQVAVGRYRVCRASASEYQAFVSGSLGRGRCSEGVLPRGGELRLSIPNDAPAPPATAP